MDSETREQLRRQRRRAWVRAVALLTVLLLAAAIPVSAWLTNQRKLAAAAPINRPIDIEIRSGGDEPYEYIKINAIDVNRVDTNGQRVTYMDFVFGVKATDDFFLQLAYTTNNPYTYTIYPAEQGTLSDHLVEYTTHGNDPQTYYYKQKPGSNALEGSFLNQQDVNQQDVYQAKKNDSFHSLSYEGVAADYVETHAEPLYWRSYNTGNTGTGGKEKVIKAGVTQYYILRVSWPAAYEENTRETDILYISAYAGTLTSANSANQG